jgi:4-amino-4-deoxy-L-arabinose transferase-like glycosyltransferase
MDKGTWRSWLLAGVVSGVAVLLKMIFIVFPMAIVIWLIVRRRKELLKTAVPLAAGLLLLLLPALIRNVAVGAPPASLSSIGPVTFVNSNFPDFDPRWGFSISWEHVPRIMPDTEGRFVPTVFATLGTHENVWSYIGLLWKKFSALWWWYDIPNNTNIYYYRLHSTTLSLTPVTFLILAPLSIVGLVLAAREGRRHGVLYLLALVHFIPIIGFYCIARFRVPLAAVLVMFAAFAVVRIVQWIGARRWIEPVCALVAIAVIGLWSARPLQDDQPRTRNEDHMAPYKVYWDPMIERSPDRAADILGESLRCEPERSRRFSPSNPPRTERERSLAESYGWVWERYGRALDKAGRKAEAERAARRVIELLRALGRE